MEQTVGTDRHDTLVLGTATPTPATPDPAHQPGEHDTLVLGQPPHWAPGYAPLPGSYPPPAMPAAWAAAAPGWDTPPPAWATWSKVPPAPAAPPVVIRRNTTAVVGATLGTVSLLLAFIPILGIVAWIIAPIGALCSGIGLLVGMRRRVGRFGAVWGLGTSTMALIVCVSWLALLLAL